MSEIKKRFTMNMRGRSQKEALESEIRNGENGMRHY